MFHEIYSCGDCFSWVSGKPPEMWGQYYSDSYGTLFIEDRCDGYIMSAEDWRHAAFTV